MYYTPDAITKYKRRTLWLKVADYIMAIFETAVLWLIIGFAVSTISLTYVVTDVLTQIDNAKVCK